MNTYQKSVFICVNPWRWILVEVVELQADGLGAGCFETVEDEDHVAVSKIARGLDEHCPLIDVIS